MMHKLFYRISSSIRNKLVLTFVLFIIPFIIAQTMFIRQSAVTMEDQLIVTAGGSHDTKEALLNDMITSIMSAAAMYRLDKLFLYDLCRDYAQPIDTLSLYEQIWGRSRNVLAAYPGIQKLTIHTDNDSLIRTTPFVLHISGHFDQSEAFAALSAGVFGHWDVVEYAAAGSGFGIPRHVEAAAERVIAYSAPLTQRSSKIRYASYLTVEHTLLEMSTILGNGDPQIISMAIDENHEPVIPVDGMEELMLLLSDCPDKVEALRVVVKGDDYLLWVSPLKNGWKIVSMATMEEIMEKADNIRNMGAVFVMLFSAAFVIIVFVFSSRFMRRSQELAQKMARFDAEKWAPYRPMKGSDEISLIDRAFLSMGEKLKDSIQREYIHELAKKKAELSLLHTQIRPHFLYNMLSCIAWTIDDQPRSVARQAVENLAAFYRYSLANGKEIITLKEELRIINAYMELQKLRLQGKICFITRVDEEFLSVKLPRMTLQALIENCILHGPGDERRPVSIVLRASVREERVVLTLEDDGVGIDADTLKKLQEGKLESSGGLGLGVTTIHERLRLYFGADYGAEVLSGRGAGTTVRIFLPALDE